MERRATGPWLAITLTEKPLFEFDLELPLGLEGRVSNSLQDWLETFLSDTLGDALARPIVHPSKPTVHARLPPTTTTNVQTFSPFPRPFTRLPLSRLCVFVFFCLFALFPR